MAMMSTILACLVLQIMPIAAPDTAIYPLTMTMYAVPGQRAQDPWFSRDKFLHFTASAGLTGLGYHVYAARLQGDPEQGAVFSVSLTGLIAFSKELYDRRRTGTFSWKDLFWDGLGIAVGYLVFIR